MSASSAVESFVIGDWVVEPDNHRLMGPDGTRHLEPKAMRMLTALAQSYPAPVSKESLLDQVWGANSVYADEALHRCAAKIRKAFGDQSRPPSYLITIPKHGYRLACDVSKAAAENVASTTNSFETHGVAVLPLEPMRNSADAAYVALGLTDDLITRLQRFRSFPVISHHSTRRYEDQPHVDLADVARDLNVSYIVTGQVRPLPNNGLRITVELASAPSWEVEWRDRFDLDMADIVTAQDEVTLAIAGQLAPEIERADRSKELPHSLESVESWHLVRRGLWHQYRLTRQDAEAAHDYFRQALEQDPNSAESHIQMAWWHWWDLAAKRAVAEQWQVMEQCARRAFIIDPRDPRSVELIGISRMMAGDPEDALAYFQKAINMNPSYAWAYNSLGSVHWVMGEPQKAIECIDLALKYSPYDLYVFHAYGDLAMCRYMIEDWPGAIAAAERSLEIRSGYWIPLLIRAVALARQGRLDDAKSALQRLLGRRPDFTIRDVHWLPFTDRRWNRHLIDSLELIGEALP